MATYATVGGSNAEVLATSAAAGAARGVSEVAEQWEFREQCMRAKGYAKIDISAEETARLKRLDGDERQRRIAEIAGEDRG